MATNEEPRFDHPEERGDGPPKFECANCGMPSCIDDPEWGGRRYHLFCAPIHDMLDALESGECSADEAEDALAILGALTREAQTALHRALSRERAAFRLKHEGVLP